MQEETEKRTKKNLNCLKKAKEDGSTLEEPHCWFGKKLQEKGENLRKSLQQFEKSAEQTHLRSEGYEVLQQQIKELTEEEKAKRN